MANNGPLELTDSTFQETIDGASGALVIDVWAPWCGPCKMVGPALKRIHGQAPERFQLALANLEDAPHTAEALNIKATPTLLIFRDGQEIARRAGAMTETQITAWLDQNLSAT